MKQNQVFVCQIHASKNRHNYNNRFTYIKRNRPLSTRIAFQSIQISKFSSILGAHLIGRLDATFTFSTMHLICSSNFCIRIVFNFS